MRILLDTSLLMLIVEEGRDLLRVAEDKLDEVIEPYVLEDTIHELEKIAGGRGKKSKLARLALKLAERMKKIEYPSMLPVDLKLIEASKQYRLVLATIDQKLIEEARKNNVPVLIFHEDLRVTLEGWVT